MMRERIMLAWLALIAAAFNYDIYQKEQIKAHGEILLLKLAPADARSEDMIYAMELELRQLDLKNNGGYMVVRADKDNIARFVRLHDEENLAAGEKLIALRKPWRSLRTVPDFSLSGNKNGAALSFRYKNARYAVFKYKNPSDYLLVGFIAENGEMITLT